MTDTITAGIPTLIKPWFGLVPVPVNIFEIVAEKFFSAPDRDQFFWASRVQRIGAGMKVGSLSSSELARALAKATSDQYVHVPTAFPMVMPNFYLLG